jgi:hypothetical protein
MIMTHCTVKKLALLCLVLGLAIQISRSQQRSCSAAQSEKADREASRLRTWDSLYRSYTRFSQCDDGSIAEGYSTSVGRLLADDWGTLPQASVVSKNDDGFRKFVLRHVSATLDTKDLQKIRMNAIRHCPDGENDFCKQLRVAADKALKANGIIVR